MALGELDSEDMPNDWNNGIGNEFFPSTGCLFNVIPDLLMYGLRSDGKADIPGGAIRGYPVSEAAGEVVLPEMRHVGCVFINRTPQSR